MSSRILTNARVLGYPEPVAIAIAGDRIAAVNPIDGVPDSRLPVVDLQGQRLLPSFVDAHVHLHGWVSNLCRLDVTGADDYGRLLARVREFARGLPPEQWVTGGGWDQNLLGRLPDATGLAGVVQPVALEARDGHAVWCNTVALQRAGLDRSSPDVPGGRILRTPAGDPTGVLLENARRSVLDLVPPLGRSDLQAGLQRAFRRLLSLGISEVHDCSSRANDSIWEAGLDLDSRGRLPIRIAAAIPTDGLDGAAELGLRFGEGSLYFRVGGVKQLADGTLGSQTAAVEAPFCGGSNRGMMCITPAELTARVSRAAALGLPSWVHVIGDRCLRHTLDALERIPGQPPLPHRIEHAQLTPPHLLDRARRLGVTMSIQPCHLISDLPLIARHWHDRSEHSYAWGSMTRAGLPLCLGSDVPVEDPDPFANLAAAVRRRPWDATADAAFHPEQALSVHHVIDILTYGGTQAGPWRGLKGRIASGQLADLVAVDPDPLTIGPDELRRCRVTRHVVGGVDRYRD